MLLVFEKRDYEGPGEGDVLSEHSNGTTLFALCFCMLDPFCQGMFLTEAEISPVLKFAIRTWTGREGKMLLKLEIKHRFYMKLEADCGEGQRDLAENRFDFLYCARIWFSVYFCCEYKMDSFKLVCGKISLRNPRLDF